MQLLSPLMVEKTGMGLEVEVFIPLGCYNKIPQHNTNTAHSTRGWKFRIKISANSMACGDPFCGSPMVASSCVLTRRPKISLGCVLQNYHGQDMCADYTLLFGIFFGGEELSIVWYEMLSLNTGSFRCQPLKAKLWALFQTRENVLLLLPATLSVEDHTRYKESLSIMNYGVTNLY